MVNCELADFGAEDEQLLSQFFFIFPNLSVSGTAEAGSNSCEDHDHGGWVIQVCHSVETPTKERLRITLLQAKNARSLIELCSECRALEIHLRTPFSDGQDAR